MFGSEIQGYKNTNIIFPSLFFTPSKTLWRGSSTIASRNSRRIWNPPHATGQDAFDCIQRAPMNNKVKTKLHSWFDLSEIAFSRPAQNVHRRNGINEKHNFYYSIPTEATIQHNCSSWISAVNWTIYLSTPHRFLYIERGDEEVWKISKNHENYNFFSLHLLCLCSPIMIRNS